MTVKSVQIIQTRTVRINVDLSNVLVENLTKAVERLVEERGDTIRWDDWEIGVGELRAADPRGHAWVIRDDGRLDDGELYLE